MTPDGHFSNYEEACTALKVVGKRGSRPGLYGIGRLCFSLGNPQDAVKTVHVAGTNGKGSVCAMTAEILKAAGYKTGLFISPTVKDYRDGLFVNGKKITEEAFARVFSRVYDKARTLEEEDVIVTEFEMLTACAFEWFRVEGCGIAVIETGMGGRLDATNVISRPLVSVITAVSIDHTDYLGSTIEEIAKEKCGIIKQGAVTVSYPQQPAAVRKEIENTVYEKENSLIIADAKQISIGMCGIFGTVFNYRGKEYSLSLQGTHQAKNAATAIETVEALRIQGLRINDEAIITGLKAAYLPARQEILRKEPLVMLDGAHNVQGVAALADTVKRCLSGKRISVVMGMLRDKQYEAAIALMATLSDCFIAVRPQSGRALDEREAAEAASMYCEKVMAYADYAEALEAAIKECGSGGAIIICGSFYLEDGMRDAVEKVFGKV